MSLLSLSSSGEDMEALKVTSQELYGPLDSWRAGLGAQDCGIPKQHSSPCHATTQGDTACELGPHWVSALCRPFSILGL